MGSRGSVYPFFRTGKKWDTSYYDPEMTRFNISLTEGVEMVSWAAENAIGGELLVPKILAIELRMSQKPLALTAKSQSLAFVLEKKY